MSRDQKFFDMYSLVLGVLGAVTIAILVLAMKMSDLTQGVYTRDGAEYQQELASRIRPLGEVYLPGEERESQAPTVEAPAAAEPVATTLSGPQVYNTACIACHGNGIAGAPVTGEAAQWVERLAQGPEVLKQHALEGFTGSTGVMPPKGGRVGLSDAEVEAAVDYMTEQLQ